MGFKPFQLAPPYLGRLAAARLAVALFPMVPAARRYVGNAEVRTKKNEAMSDDDSIICENYSFSWAIGGRWGLARASERPAAEGAGMILARRRGNPCRQPAPRGVSPCSGGAISEDERASLVYRKGRRFSHSHDLPFMGSRGESGVGDAGAPVVVVALLALLLAGGDGGGPAAR